MCVYQQTAGGDLYLNKNSIILIASWTYSPSSLVPPPWLASFYLKRHNFHSQNCLSQKCIVQPQSCNSLSKLMDHIASVFILSLNLLKSNTIAWNNRHPVPRSCVSYITYIDLTRLWISIRFLPILTLFITVLCTTSSFIRIASIK